MKRASWWCWGGAAVALLLFFRLTRELLEGEVNATDRGILQGVIGQRKPWLTIAAMDVTALGSITLVILFTALALVILLLLRDRWGALQLLAASVGAAVLTLVTKNLVERARPDQAAPLIVADGFSYPSGHSVEAAALYLTIALIAARHIRHASVRMVVWTAAPLLLLLVAASRVYLGVHYASDAASGISLGVAWALALQGLITTVRR